MATILEVAARYGIVPPTPFVPIYKYRTVQQTIDILTKMQIWFAPADELDDPFEFNNDLIDMSLSKAEWEHKMSITDTFKNLKLSAEKKENILKEVTAEKAKEIYLLALDMLRKETGVFSCSDCFDITPMWSKYADMNKGVCIGFVLPPALPGETYSLLKTNYIDSIQPIKMVAQEDDEAYLLPLIYWVATKHIQWAYQREIRAVYMYKTGAIEIFDTNIVELYYGLNTSQSDVNEIEQLLTGKNYNAIKRYKMEKEGYKLVAKPFNMP